MDLLASKIDRIKKREYICNQKSFDIQNMCLK